MLRGGEADLIRFVTLKAYAGCKMLRSNPMTMGIAELRMGTSTGSHPSFHSALTAQAKGGVCGWLSQEKAMDRRASGETSPWN